ncbi:MAG: cell division protein ZapA [Clostridia bacterium]|nr:cell division protein ZapA [Clostridia bacterium]
MSQRYTITLSGMPMNIITDESPEAVEAIVGIIDRRMREINLKSNRCSKTEAALLCALDYCSDKIKSQRKVKKLESMIAEYELKISELEEEIAELEAKLDK